MFQIGEFSKIARVSTRQLRHYDELGLLRPARVDAETGYRYYSADQLPRLNRILALKELGLSLDQIARLLAGDVSAQEIHGMLSLKKAQIEQTLQEELARVRSIEDRIWQIETEGVLNDVDVVVQPMPEQRYLSVRQVVPTVRDGFELMVAIHRLLPQRSGRSVLGSFGLIFHNEGFTTEDIDVEMGFLLDGDYYDEFPLPDGRVLTQRIVPPVDHMATLVRVGIYNDSVGHYGALGAWLERNHYQIDGPGWEVFVQPFVPGKEDEAVVEIRMPVRPEGRFK